MSTYYIAVVSTDTDTRRLKSYLYGHSEIFWQSTYPREFADTPYLCVILRVVADTDTRAEFLAHYQEGRLQSGSFFASVQDTVEDAEYVLTQRVNGNVSAPFEGFAEVEVTV